MRDAGEPTSLDIELLRRFLRVSVMAMALYALIMSVIPRNLVFHVGLEFS